MTLAAERSPGPLTPDGESTSRAAPARRTISAAHLIALAVFASSFFLAVFRTEQVLDLRSDEATYAIESVALGQTGMTQWDGSPFLVQPPVFFGIESLYFRVRGVGFGPLFERLLAAPYEVGQPLLPPDAPASADSMVRAIVAGRELSAVYGAVTATLLFYLGRRLLDMRVGLVAAGLFALDPYSLFLRHFNLLEPLGAMVGLAAAGVYLSALRTDHGRRRWTILLGSAVAFGGALLIKELALVYLAPLLVHGLVFRRVRLRELVAMLGTAGATYLVFPAWAAGNGLLPTWWSTRVWLFERVTGQIRDSGLNRSSTSLGRALSFNLGDYWPWLALLALAGMLSAAFVYLYLRRGLRDPAGEFLAASVLGQYGFFVLVWRLGGVLNEQYFYLAMPMVSLSVAYAAVAWPQLLRMNWTTRHSARLTRLAVAALGVLMIYNTRAWVAHYWTAREDSFIQIDSPLAEALPAGAPVLGRDVLDMYLMPRSAVYAFGYFNYGGRLMDPATIIDHHILYAILNDQYLLQGYGGANSASYDFVRATGDLKAQFRGRLWTTQLYAIDPARLTDRSPD